VDCGIVGYDTAVCNGDVDISEELEASLFWASFEKTVKAKAILLQAWTGPEGSRSLRLPDFKRIAT